MQSPSKNESISEKAAWSSTIFGVRLKDVASGIASGVSKVAVGHPFDTIKVRLQTEGQGGRFKGPIHALLVTLRTEGIRGLYKGAFPPLVGFGATDSLMVSAYLHTRRALQDPSSSHEPITNVFLAGAVGGWVCTLICTPMELIKAKLQVQYSDSATKRYSGSIDCARKLVHNHGIKGLYIGWVPTMMFRSFVSVYFGAYEMFKQSMISLNMPQWSKNFVRWTVSFPTDVVKNRIQAQPDVPMNERKYHGTLDCVQKIYRYEGFSGFYRGFTPCLLRSAPANGAAFVALELVSKYMP